MARKRRWKRTSPDMGWIVVSQTFSMTLPALDNTILENNEIFTFDDIDELDSVMTKDKSDWFIKRVILNVYPVINRSSDLTAPVRLWECAVHTSGDQDALVMQATQNMTIMNPTWYDHTRRILRTYSRPVYDPYYPALLSGGTLSVGSTPITRLDSIQNNWGDAQIRDDFAVSNAGLVPESSLYLTACMSDLGPLYSTGDSLVIAYSAQVLLQKRRGG